MKKELKNLKLSKQSVAKFNLTEIKGGNTNGGCYDSFQRTCPKKCFP